ncbi:hypothetical protein OIE68_20580 [Nocardia vinacea]|uniref:Uncharacterized protein n=1 Tax=Nocardia vinacea TaxID=96468 RepID=A0ABZ1YXH0_9NOCA|nr:hypothetical protein OIE68_20580 [Nocardia vinacea]
MPIRLSAPPHAGCTSGIPIDRHQTQHGSAGVGRTGIVDRRTALRLAGGTTVGVLAVGAVAGCTDKTVYQPDPLAAQENLARADAAAATAAIAVTPQRHAALTAIANERTAHADALRAEINRAIGVYGDGTTPTHRTREVTPPASGTSPAASGASTTTPPSIDELRTRLAKSQQSAGDLARTQSGYRAGLLASISASCAAQAGVLLA